MSRTATTPVTWTPDSGSTLAVAGHAVDAWVWGAYVEVLASAPADTFVGAIHFAGQLVPFAEFEFAVGAAGAEVPVGVIGTNGYISPISNGPTLLQLPVPFRATTTVARLAVRMRTSTGGFAVPVRVGYYEGLDATTKTDAHPAMLPAGATLIFTPTGTPWGNTAYQELAADIGADPLGFAALAANFTGISGYDAEVDVAVGAAGAEVVVATFRAAVYNHSSNGNLFNPLPALVAVPAHSRLACRIRRAGTATDQAWVRALVYGPEAAPEPPPTEIEFPPERDVTGETIGLTFAELRDVEDNLLVVSDVDLDDRPEQYGGPKQAEVVSWGSIRRALSNYRGEPDGTTFAWRLADTARKWRGYLAAGLLEINNSVVIRMISDAARRAARNRLWAGLELLPEQLARTIVRGSLRRWEALPNLLFELFAEDTLSRLLRTPVPRGTISLTDFPGAQTTDVNGSVVPMESVGKCVPVFYGVRSDENLSVTPGTALTTPTLVGVQVVGGTAGVTKRYALTLGNADYAVPLGAWADHRGETDPLWVTVNNAPTDEDMRNDPANHYLVISIDHQAGATRGRCYGRYPNSEAYGLDALDHPGAFGVVPADQWQYWEARRPYGAPDWNTQKRAGVPPTTNNTGGTSVDTGRGVLKPLYVGLLDGRHCWVVAGHACYSAQPVIGWYVDGVRQAASTAAAGAAWLIPGHAAYAAVYGTQTWRDINGHRYTLIYGEPGHPDPDDCANGEKTLTINAYGCENVGDSSGDLIVSMLQQYKHFVTQFGFQDWRSGPWLDAPAFPADPPPEDADFIRMIDDTSFDRADAVAAARLAGGYPGAMIFVEQMPLRDHITRCNQNCDVDSGFNRRTQFFVDMEDDDPAQLVPVNEGGTALRYTQQHDGHIIEGSFRVTEEDQELFTVTPYALGYRPADGSWDVVLEGDDAPRNATKITRMQGEERTAQRLNFFFLTAAPAHIAVAEDIMARVLARSSVMPRRVTLHTGLGGLSSELASIGLISHEDGPAAGGWVDHPVRFREHQISPGRFEVELVGRDQRHLFGDEGGES